jgi:hypothetical protein
VVDEAGLHHLRDVKMSGKGKEAWSAENAARDFQLRTYTWLADLDDETRVDTQGWIVGRALKRETQVLHESADVTDAAVIQTGENLTAIASAVEDACATGRFLPTAALEGSLVVPGRLLPAVGARVRARQACPDAGDDRRNGGSVSVQHGPERKRPPDCERLHGVSSSPACVVIAWLVINRDHDLARRYQRRAGPPRRASRRARGAPRRSRRQPTPRAPRASVRAGAPPVPA